MIANWSGKVCHQFQDDHDNDDVAHDNHNDDDDNC